MSLTPLGAFPLGTFRATRETVMSVLRRNKDSVMAMLEAFIHDPLIKWRLLQAHPAAALACGGRHPREATRAACRGQRRQLGGLG